MFHHTDKLERVITFNTLLRTYETLTGLTNQCLTHDANSMWIEWAYPDGTWAGTTSYERPLEQINGKLARQIEQEYRRLQAGEPMLIYRDQDFVLTVEFEPDPEKIIIAAGLADQILPLAS